MSTRQNFTILIFTVLFLTSTFSYAQTIWDWEKYSGNPVLSPGQSDSWENYGVYAPFVLKHGDTLKMWYTGSKGYDVQQIGYAISFDGINWQKYQHNPVLKVGAPGSWDSRYVGYSEIIIIDNTYHMWYGGHDDFSNPSFQIGYATSPDGINWTKYAGNPVFPLGDTEEWESATLAGGSIFFDGDTFHLWYGGCNNTDFINSRIGYATSQDGINWEKHPDNPIFYGSGSWDSVSITVPCVIVDTSGYKMWYQGYDGSDQGRIGYAISSDGINWSAMDTPVLDIGDPGSWDDQSVVNPHVLLDDTLCHMWYLGEDYGTPNYAWQIGYATADTISGIYDGLSVEVPSNFVLMQNYPNPFNPTTVIIWQLAVSSHVDLSVYNILGKKVATLVSGKQKAGLHQVEWDATGFASGIYYYIIKAGEFRDVKKMILIK
jgi:predicted GH43/DUF377 family glycosyl hydrolase